MNKSNYRTVNTVKPVKGFLFSTEEHPKKQPNAAPSIREVISKFQVGIPIGQYVRQTEYGDFDNPTSRPDFDFAKAAQLNQEVQARLRLGLKAAKEKKDGEAEPSSSKPSNEPASQANPTEGEA